MIVLAILYVMMSSQLCCDRSRHIVCNDVHASVADMSAKCTTPSSYADFKDATATIGDDSKSLPNHNVRKRTVRKKRNKCGAQFDRSNQLTIRIHPGEKLFKCDMCGLCFTRNRGLITHLRTHTGEKTFKCDKCASCFAQSGSLKAHLRSREGEKPFVCELCGLCFALNGNLKKHNYAHSYWRETIQM